MTTTNPTLKKLEGGDPRSQGQILLVAGEVEENPALLADLFEGAAHPDPLVKLRSVMAIERVTADHPEYLEPYKARLMNGLAGSDQRMYRRTLISLLSRLRLDDTERPKVKEV